MKQTNYDVAVIGAGPGGSVAARKLAKLGHSVVLLEKRERIGYPVRCGEASTKLDRLEQDYGPIDPACIETVLNGLYVYGPGGINLDVRRENVGVMLNREKFDPWLAHLAELDGAEVAVNARVECVSDVEDGVRTLSVVTATERVQIKAKMVVCAEGVEARIARSLGIKAIQKPGETCTGVDIQVQGILTRPDYLTFWQGHDFINDGYIWSFPKQKSNVTNFGAGFLVNSYKGESIESMTLGWLKKLYPDAKINKVVGGLVPVSGSLESYVLDRFVAVGDAAHHTNPLTGGGISTAMRAGKAAAEIIHEGFAAWDLSAKFLHRYERRCEELFGREHTREKRFRKFLLTRDKEDQIAAYGLIRDYIDGGESKLAAFKKPGRALRLLWDYMRSK